MTEMDLRFTDQELAFRDEVRRFMQTSLPDGIRRKMIEGRHVSKDDLRCPSASTWSDR